MVIGQLSSGHSVPDPNPNPTLNPNANPNPKKYPGWNYPRGNGPDTKDTIVDGMPYIRATQQVQFKPSAIWLQVESTNWCTTVISVKDVALVLIAEYLD